MKNLEPFLQKKIEKITLQMMIEEKDAIIKSYIKIITDTNYTKADNQVDITNLVTLHTSGKV